MVEARSNLRRAALAAGIGLDRLTWAAVRAPRPVLLGAGVAALAGMAAVIHFTGFVPAGGTATIQPYFVSPRTPGPR